MVGNNTPVFFLRDPLKFPDFIHSQKKDPRTNLPDPANHYEFWSNHPQSLHQITILMSDRGIPASLRNINGYSSHTLSFWNAEGVRYWVKWHFKTNQGIKCLSAEEASRKPANFHQQDLVDAIDKGQFPGWTVKVQIMTTAEAKTYRINPFDLTKVWAHKDYPLIEIGQMELNRNVTNYFAETEQAAFSPSNLVPGIGVSPDKMLQARLLAYQDAHNYRIGANANQLPINAPIAAVNHYQRDGAMAGGSLSSGGQMNADPVNFYPNDRGESGAPVPDASVAEPPMPIEEEAWIKTYNTIDDNHYEQAGDLFRIMSAGQKEQLAGNIAGGLSQATPSVQARMLEQFALADPDYADLVKKAMGS